MIKNKTTNNCSPDDCIHIKNNNFKYYIITFLIVFFSIIFGYKLITTNNFVFQFSDLLALILALFAVYLSTIFYIKNNEVSNQFYERFQNFTSEVSKLLTQIDTEFKLRLSNLESSTEEIKQRTMSIDANNHKKDEISKIKEKSQSIINQESNNENIDKYLQLKEKIRKKEKERDDEIKKNLRSYFALDNNFKDLNANVINYAYLVIGTRLSIDDILNLEKNDLSFKFKKVSNFITRGFINDMIRFGLLNLDKELTDKGYLFIQEIAKFKINYT